MTEPIAPKPRAPNEPFGTLSAYEPSWRENLAATLARYVFGDDRRGHATGGKIAGIADFIPGVGTGLAIDDTARALDEGSYGEAALNALGLIPELGPAAKAMFIGAGSQLFRKDMAKLAQEMKAKGAHTDDIWRATGDDVVAGTMFGPRGEAIQEISDDAAHFNADAFPRGGGMAGFMDEYARQHHGVDRALQLPPNSRERLAAVRYGSEKAQAARTKPLSEVLEHPDLYRAYPDVADIPIGREPNSFMGFKGSYSDGEIGITENVRDKRSTALHETQHAIQEREGWPRGNSPYAVANHPDPAVQEAYADEIKRRLETSGDTYIDAQAKAKHSVYERSWGETQARNTQARSNMTLDERKAMPPRHTQDIADERQIASYAPPGAAASWNPHVVPDNPAQVTAKGKDPEWFHGVGGGVKLPRPFSEMTSTMVPTGAMTPTRLLDPAGLQGGIVTPLYGDKTMAGQTLTHINGVPLSRPQPLQGGPRFMQEFPGSIWASEKSQMTKMSNAVQRMAESGKPVYGVHVAMSPVGGDFARMTTRPLLDMAQQAKIKRADLKLFDEEMRGETAGRWPGLMKAGDDWLASAPGVDRATLAQTMHLARYQKAGFPDVGSLRKAITEPELVNRPMLTTGRTVGQFDPMGKLSPGAHDTYGTQIAGDYVGDLGALPLEAVFPDFVASRPPREPLPHTGKTLQTKPDIMQEADQRWLDNLMQHLLRGGRE